MAAVLVVVLDRQEQVAEAVRDRQEQVAEAVRDRQEQVAEAVSQVQLEAVVPNLDLVALPHPKESPSLESDFPYQITIFL